MHGLRARARLPRGVTAPFHLDCKHDDGSYRLALTGELDLATVPEFERALRTACADGARAVTIDLSGLTFIDSTGLRAILEGHQICSTQGREYWIDRKMQTPVKRLLEIAGVGQLPFANEP